MPESLPRPDDLIEANQSRECRDGSPGRTAHSRPGSPGSAVADVVRRQREPGITVPGDGEFGKAMGHRGQLRRLVELLVPAPRRPRADRSFYPIPPSRSEPRAASCSRSFADRRDSAALRRRLRGPRVAASRPDPAAAAVPVCVGPLTYTGHEAIASRHRQLQGGPAGAGVEEGFMTSIAPGSASPHRQRPLRDRRGIPLRLRRRHARGVPGHRRRRPHPPARRSGHRRELGHGQSGAHRRGLPAVLACSAWRRSTTPSAACPRTASASTSAGEAGTGPTPPTSRCGTSSTSMLAIKCRRLLVRGRQRPPRARVEGVARRQAARGQVILPGIVSHATNVVEHPELVAERIARFAGAGRPGARHRLHRLRPRRAGPPADRLGEAGGPGPRGGNRLQPSLRPLGQPASKGAGYRDFLGGRSPADETAAGDRHVATPLDLLYLDQIRGAAPAARRPSAAPGSPRR